MPARGKQPKKPSRVQPKPNDRQRRWCEEYLVDSNGAAACIRAGYSPNGADVRAVRLKATPHVMEYLQKLMEERSKRTEITVDKVLGDLESARTKAMDKGDYRSAIKASHLQGKHIGMFTDKVEHSGTIEHTIKGMSDADLDARIRQLLPKAGIGPAS